MRETNGKRIQLSNSVEHQEITFSSQFYHAYMLEIIREEKLKDIFGNNVYRFNKFVYIIKYFIIYILLDFRTRLAIISFKEYICISH